jgi:hypothetical protein
MEAIRPITAVGDGEAAPRLSVLIRYIGGAALDAPRASVRIENADEPPWRRIDRAFLRASVGGGAKQEPSGVDAASLDIERRDAFWLAVLAERDFFDARLGLAQQGVATALQRIAALIELHGVIERDGRLFELADNVFQLLHRFFEWQAGDVGVGLRHGGVSFGDELGAI